MSDADSSPLATRWDIAHKPNAHSTGWRVTARMPGAGRSGGRRPARERPKWIGLRQAADQEQQREGHDDQRHDDHQRRRIPERSAVAAAIGADHPDHSRIAEDRNRRREAAFAQARHQIARKPVRREEMDPTKMTAATSSSRIEPVMRSPFSSARSGRQSRKIVYAVKSIAHRRRSCQVTRPAQARIAAADAEIGLGSERSCGHRHAALAAGGGQRVGSRQAMVIGPTPPGTGVMAPAMRHGLGDRRRRRPAGSCRRRRRRG